MRKLTPFPYTTTLYKNGEMYYLDAGDDLIKNHLKSGATWEPEIRVLLEEHIQPGSAVVDVGAHIGTHSIAMSKLTGEQGKVYSFEPQQKLCRELHQNAKLNRADNIIPLCCALSASEGTATMAASFSGNEGATSFGQGGNECPVTALDSLQLENISVIKIDVENREREVLIGAKETILKNKPVIILEIMGNTYDPNPQREQEVEATLKLLESYGYSANFIEGSWSDWLALPNQP